MSDDTSLSSISNHTPPLGSMRAITDLVSLSRFILSPECKSIVVLTGAGVSVASGM